MEFPQDRRPGLSLPTFGLSSFLVGIAFLGMLFAVSRQFGTYGAALATLFVLIVAAHFAGATLGSRLRQCGDTPLDSAGQPIEPAPRGRPVSAEEFAPPSRLQGRHALGEHVILLTVLGASGGGALGYWGLSAVADDRTTAAVMLLGSGACAVLGGIGTFAVTCFLQVTLGELMQWKSAPAAEPTQTRSEGAEMQRVARRVRSVALLAAGLAILWIGWQWWSSDQTAWPELTAARWTAAKDRWLASSLGDYSLEVVVSGRQGARYAVDVQRGEVIRATRNGELLPQRRTWSTWSVDGMLETIGRDLDTIARRESGSGDNSTPQLWLRARFDEQFGFPRNYLRTEGTRSGANPEVSWEVVRFEPLSVLKRIETSPPP